MSKSFYSVYFEVSSEHKNSKKGWDLHVKSVVCTKHGFSFKYVFPYVGAIIAFVNRQYIACAILFGLSLLYSKTLLSIANVDPFAGNAFVFLSYFALGTYGPTLFEADVASGNRKFGGVFLAHNEDDAIRSFYKSVSSSGQRIK